MNNRQIIIRPATPDDVPIIASALTMALGEETMKMYCGENSQCSENPKAEHLYLSLGFERVEVRNLFGHRMWHL